LFNIFNVFAFSPRVAIPHGAASWPIRNSVPVKRLLKDQHAGGTRPAQEFVRRKIDGVQMRIFVNGVYVNINIWRGAREVDEAIATMTMDKPGDLMIGRPDARDIRARRYRRYLIPALPVLLQQFSEMTEVHIPVRVPPDDLYRSDRLQPAEMVAVVLHMGDKDYRPQGLVQGGAPVTAKIVGEAFGYPQAQYTLQLVDSGRHAAAAKDEYVVLPCIDMLLHNVPRLFVGP